jgi:opacity protein-like surface antigen
MTVTTRSVGLLLVTCALIGGSPAFAQDRPVAGPARAEITIIPGGATFFTESGDKEGPSFGSYSLGGAFAYNVNRVFGVEGEVGSTLGVTQSLDFGFPSDVRTPDMVSYSGNAVVSLPTHSSVVPYVTGGVGGLTVLANDDFDIPDHQTFLTGNVGAGIKWYAGRWGLRADYRFVAVQSQDDAPAFFGRDNRYGHRVYGAVMLNLGR